MYDTYRRNMSFNRRPRAIFLSGVNSCVVHPRQHNVAVGVIKFRVATLSRNKSKLSALN